MIRCAITGHRWRRVRDMGVWRYVECRRCGKRDARRLYVGGMSPKASGWLSGGTFMDTSTLRPPPAPADRR